MSTTSGSRYAADRGSDTAGRSAAYEESVNGWVIFAGAMLGIVGILNFVYGIAAIDSSSFYVNDARYIFSGLNTWGWITMILGAGQVAGAGGLLVSGSAWGRWIGIGTAALNAMGQLLWISSSPWLSLALFAIDVLVLYGLIAHGGRRARA